MRADRVALASVLLAGAAPASAPDGELLESVVRIPREGALLALRDLDGDGALDLLRIDASGIAVRLLRHGRYPDADDTRLDWPTQNLAWDFSDLDGDGASEITMLLAGREVRSWRLEGVAAGEVALAEGGLALEASSYLPAGVSRMNFVRDVDGDGRADLVLPVTGHYQLYLQADEGFAPPIRIVHESHIDYSVGDPGTLSSTFGQDVILPWFTIEDVDGDGRRDLISREEDQVAFHLAAPELPAEPTWRLDLAALRDELPEQRGFDFDDLFSNVAHRVEWRLEDLDGRYPRDVILMIGSTFKVYLGAAAAGPGRSPDQVLKSSGNVLYFFVRDVQGDALPELQLARGERISLGRVLRYLILPGKLDFDLFTYLNERGSFSRKPTKRATLSLKIPRLLSLIDDDERFEELEQAYAIPTSRVAFDRDGIADDIVDLRDGALLVYRDLAPDPASSKALSFEGDDIDEAIESLVLRDLDELDDGGTKTVDLGDIEALKLSVGAELRRACEGARADLRHPISGAEPSLQLADIDGDEITDFLVISESDSGYRVVFLVRSFSD